MISFLGQNFGSPENPATISRASRANLECFVGERITKTYTCPNWLDREVVIVLKRKNSFEELEVIENPVLTASTIEIPISEEMSLRRRILDISFRDRSNADEVLASGDWHCVYAAEEIDYGSSSSI